MGLFRTPPANRVDDREGLSKPQSKSFGDPRGRIKASRLLGCLFYLILGIAAYLLRQKASRIRLILTPSTGYAFGGPPPLGPR
jgi:hypothetical protein